MRISSFVLASAVALTVSACGGGGGGSNAGGPAPPPGAAAAANSPPTISSVPSQTIAQDAISDPIAFEVSDAQSAATDVAVSAASSNSELIGADAISISGQGASRKILLRPSAGISGSTTVTLTATDALGAVTNQTFEVAVTSEQRSFREMVGAAYEKAEESEGEPIVGYTWVDTAEDDEAAFDHLFP